MPVNRDLLNSIISGLNSLPKKSEIDTADNDIDLLATETTHGLMSYQDKSKLNKIDESANNYTLPMASYDVLGGIKSGIQETDSTGLEPIPIIGGIPYYKPYKLPIASSGVLGGIKAGDGVNISSDGTLTIKSVDSGNFEGILAIENGGTGADNKVDARKKLNTIPYIVCGNITLTDETNSGYYHIFSLNQYSNNTICLKILINSKISEPTMFDLILTSDDSTKSKPVVKLYEAARSNVSNLLNILYVVQTDTEPSGEIQLWYKNVSANTPIKVTIIQVSSLYSNDEHDAVSLSSIPNTAVDVMSTTLNNVYTLKNCIISSEATNSEPGYLSVADKIKLDGIDSVLSGKANSSHTHTISDISDFPTSLPADGGNADTVGELHSSDFIRRYGSAMLSAEYVSAAAMDTDYKGVIDSAVANNIGLDGSNSCWWHIIGLKNFNNDGYGTQIAIPLFPTTPLQKPKYRTSTGTVFQSWQNFADGGNAGTIGGKSIDDIFHSKTINAVGDIDNTDGNWSVSLVPAWTTISGTFPDGIGSWLVINQCQTSASRDFKIQICQSIDGTPQMWFRSKQHESLWSGWQRVNDGGNADTAKTLSQWGRDPTLNLDNVDLGFIAASGEANSAPNTFWSTVLTVGQGVQSYAAQLAFPWLYDSSQAMKYRVLSNGIWYDWQEIYTSGNKPYITGDATVKANSSVCASKHGFMPSAVLWWENKGAVYSATSFDTTSFNMAIAASGDRTINYIIFK